MTPGKAFLLFVVPVFIKYLIIVKITKKHKSIFDEYTAAEYPRAIAKLTQLHPQAGWTIRLCYLLILVDTMVMVFTK